MKFLRNLNEKQKKYIKRTIALVLAVILCVTAGLLYMPDRRLKATSEQKDTESVSGSEASAEAGSQTAEDEVTTESATEEVVIPPRMTAEDAEPGEEEETETAAAHNGVEAEEESQDTAAGGADEENEAIADASENTAAGENALQDFAEAYEDAGTGNAVQDPEVLGYVSDENGGFILKSSLTFKCRKKAPDCAPESLGARKLSKTVYLIKPGSIAEWQDLYQTISALPDVTGITISKDYGMKMNLR